MDVPSKTFTRAEVAKHNTEDSVWFIVDTVVYDVSDFLDAHPGGEAVLRQVAGQDATAAFYNLHRQEVLVKYKDLAIGTIAGEKQSIITPQPGDISLVPYAEPLWLTPQFKSPYFKDSHRRLQKAMRLFTDLYITPEALEKERTGEHIGQHLIDRMSKSGVLHMRMGPGKHLHGVELLGGGVVDGKEFDYFHDMIVAQEQVRAACRGFQDGNMAGMVIGLTCILNFCKDPAMKQRISDEVFSGQKKICLAITEAFAGSDVAGLRTTAKKTADGKHYIVNGEKKWITNGIWSDYFTVAVRTGKPGMNGVSLLLIERDFGGVSTRRMDCQGVWSSGTTYITFEDVKVPVENLIGKENQGFRVIMTNFNHERIGIIIQCLRFSRVCYEESVRYANKRKTFGKKLIDHPVIRLKLAHMARQIEASYNWLENMLYQCEKMGETEAMLRLGGPIASLKAQATVTFEFCAREASQIFGGLSYSRGGQGGKVERLYRDVRAYAIPGGSEEIMLDLSIRQSMRVAKMTGMKL